MRVCVIVPGFSASEEDWCIPALLDYVRRASIDVELWLLALRYPHEATSYTVHGASVCSLGFGDRRGMARALMVWRAVTAAAREHRKRPFDLIHGFWADEAGLVATLCGRMLRRSTLVSVMGGELVWFEDLGYGLQGTDLGRRIVRRNLRSAGRVSVGSALLEPPVRAIVPASRIHRLPLGVDVSRFHSEVAPGTLDGDPVLLSVASLSPVKDHRSVIEAFSEVRSRFPEGHLHLVGDGSQRPELEGHAASIGVAGSVTFHGDVPHDLLPALYRAADLHVVGSRFESQGVATLEAAACGIATVGTTVGVLPELAGGSRVVPAGDAAALAAELSEVLADRHVLREMGEAARRIVHERFTLDHCTNRFLDLYRQALE